MLSKKAKYAIKALIYLAKQCAIENRPVLISEISEKERIPKKFLETILLELKNNGFLHSKKGKHGGYYLRLAPQDINLGKIIRLIDGPLALVPCVSLRFYERCDECADEETCGIRGVFAEVRDATNRILEKSSLAEIMKSEQDLKARIMDENNPLINL